MKTVRDNCQRIVFDNREIFSFRSEVVRTSDHNNCIIGLPQYRVDPDCYNVAFSERSFLEHFKLIDDHRNSQIDLLLNEKLK